MYEGRESGQTPERNITLNGNPLTWHKSVKHLGNVVTHDLKDDDDIALKKGAFIGQVNKLNSKFSTVQTSLKARLLQTYCCSWYGCQTWDLTSRSADSMNIEWNKAVRRTLCLPFRTRTCLLPLLVHGKNFASQHKSRILKFFTSFNDSNNSHVLYIGERAKCYVHGALGRNYVRCRVHQESEPVSPDLQVRALAISELLDVNDKIRSLPSFSHDEIKSVIEFLCCY